MLVYLQLVNFSADKKASAHGAYSTLKQIRKQSIAALQIGYR